MLKGLVCWKIMTKVGFYYLGVKENHNANGNAKVAKQKQAIQNGYNGIISNMYVLNFMACSIFSFKIVLM